MPTAEMSEPFKPINATKHSRPGVEVETIYDARFRFKHERYSTVRVDAIVDGSRIRLGMLHKMSGKVGYIVEEPTDFPVRIFATAINAAQAMLAARGKIGATRDA